MLLFDENDTSDWQHSVHETRTSELSDDQHDSTDHMQQPNTDIPGVWKWQVEPKSDLYGDRTGKLMDLEKVVRGRLTELKHMNDRHVYDWIDEANIPKGTKIETSRCCDEIKPSDGDETNVRSRIVVQQYNVVKRDEAHQGTPPLRVLRMLLALATSKDAHRRKVCGIWDVSVAFVHSPMDEFTVVRPPPGLRVKGKLWVLNRALYGTRMARRCFGKLVAEVLTNAQFETVSIVPNTYHHPQRDIDTVVHGDDFVAVAEDGQLDHFEQVLENSMEIKRGGRIGRGRSSTGKVLKRVVHWSGDGSAWKADPRLIEKLIIMLNLSGGKSVDPWRQRHRERRSRQYYDAKLVQATAGLEQYIALDRPDTAYSVKKSLPTKLMQLRVVRVGRYLKNNPRLVWKFPYQQQLKSICGLCSQRDTVEVHVWSCGVLRESADRVRALSTGEAELYAITKGSAHSLHSQAILKGFGATLEAVVLSDASAGVGDRIAPRLWTTEAS